MLFRPPDIYEAISTGNEMFGDLMKRSEIMWTDKAYLKMDVVRDRVIETVIPHHDQ